MFYFAQCLTLCIAVSAIGGVVVEDSFGAYPDRGIEKTVRRFTFTNKNNATLQVINYGATITSIRVPCRHGNFEDVALGFDDMNGYIENIGDPHIGSTIGRVANRIGKAQFTIDGTTYHVTKNAGENHLHGGAKAFDKVLWDSHIYGDKVVFSYYSPDGEEGYPGQVLSHVTYSLSDDNEVIINMIATSSKPTPVNMANHAYINLAGHGSGAEKLYDHVVTINADSITPAIDTIPTGEVKPVQGTIFDLRTPKVLRDVMPRTPEKGYDNNFCVNQETPGQKTFVARVEHPGTGRVLEVFSNQPGVQFYTSNHLPERDILKGKGGVLYKKHGALCLETQLWPDAANQPNFPNSILRPGDVYTHNMVYKFSANPNKSTVK